MSIKSTFNSAKPSEPKRPTLPHLFRSPLGSVALFDAEDSATILHNDSGVYMNEQHTKCIGSC